MFKGTTGRVHERAKIEWRKRKTPNDFGTSSVLDASFLESSDPSIAVSCDHETYIPFKVWLMLCFDFRITLKVVCGNEIHERTRTEFKSKNLIIKQLKKIKMNNENKS